MINAPPLHKSSPSMVWGSKYVTHLHDLSVTVPTPGSCPVWVATLTYFDNGLYYGTVSWNNSFQISFGFVFYYSE